MLLARLTQMHMHVNKSRRDKQTTRVENFIDLWLGVIWPDPVGNPTVLNEDIHSRVFGGRWIDDMAVFYE